MPFKGCSFDETMALLKSAVVPMIAPGEIWDFRCLVIASNKGPTWSRVILLGVHCLCHAFDPMRNLDFGSSQLLRLMVGPSGTESLFAVIGMSPLSIVRPSIVVLVVKGT